MTIKSSVSFISLQTTSKLWFRRPRCPARVTQRNDRTHQKNPHVVTKRLQNWLSAGNSEGESLLMRSIGFLRFLSSLGFRYVYFNAIELPLMTASLGD